MKRHILIAMVSLCAIDAQAQTSVSLGSQVTKESDIVSGEAYILQSMASSQTYVEDKGTYYSIPNNNQLTEACVYTLTANGDGTWEVRGWTTGKCWGVPVYDQAIVPVSPAQAGRWSLNFKSGIAYPTAPDAGGTVRGLDRSSGKLWAYDVGTKGTKQIKIYRLSGGILSSTPLQELDSKVVSVADKATDDLVTGQWYVMFDRGYTSGNPHGYLYEKAESHTLYNTADVPAGRTVQAARFLVRLSDADEGKYHVQTGFGNYFGAFTKSTAVPTTATAEEAVVIDKIAGTDGHFYLQSTSTGIILDANDLRQGDATVVGWGDKAPTTTGGNNDWAFYPVTLSDIGDEVALFEEDVTVARGYQTTGRGNRDALLLRIELSPAQDLSRAQLTFSLDEQTRRNLSSLYLYETDEAEFLAHIPEAPVATTDAIGETATLDLGPLAAGTHRFWLCTTISEEAQLGDIVKADLLRMDYRTTSDVSLDLSAVGAPSRQGMRIFDRQHFIFVPTTDDCRFYRIPAMMLDQANNIVVAIDKRYGSNADLGNHKIDVISMRSEDGGRTWKDKANVAIGDGYTAAYFGYGDCALARADNGDLVAIMASGSKTWGYGMVTAGYARSTDNGKSWTLVKNLLDSPGFYDENSTDGSLSVTNIFTTSGKGLTTTDGIIMFTTNCKNDLGTVNYILYSTDNGVHWRLSNAVAYSGCDESKLEQLNDGSLLLSVRQSGNRGWNTGTYTKQADGTVSFRWGQQYRSSDIWGNACNGDLLYYSRSTDDQADIMLHSYINSSGRESLQTAMSLDGGKSWKSAFNIQPNGSCYSTMLLLPDGDVAILFEDESFSAGNGYAINFVTLTASQILNRFAELGGILPTHISETPQQGTARPTSSDNVIYDLSGRRISLPAKGLYLTRGKKIIVR